MSDQVALSMREVNKAYSGRQVLHNLCLEVPAGRCVALLGPNGAGKSTTIGLALGLLQQGGGQIRLLGHKMPESAHHARAQAGVVPQYDGLDSDFSVLENLLVFGRYFGLRGDVLRKRAFELLDFIELRERANEPVMSLSGGMRRRLVLARALVNSPKILFLDEPTTGLDPQARHIIWDRLLQLKAAGMAMLLTTHDMTEAQRLADQVAILNHGAVARLGSPEALVRDLVGDVVLEVWGPACETFLAKCCGVNVAQLDRRGASFFFTGALAQQVFASMRDGGEGLQSVYRPGNLEDVYFKMTGKGLQDD